MQNKDEIFEFKSSKGKRTYKRTYCKKCLRKIPRYPDISKSKLYKEFTDGTWYCDSCFHRYDTLNYLNIKASIRKRRKEAREMKKDL